MSTTTCDLAAEVRGLSSGTIAGLIRDEYYARLRNWRTSRFTDHRRGFEWLNPRHASDYWILDRVQFAFSRYATLLGDESCDSWQDAWTLFVRAQESARFKVGYMGETDYEVIGQPCRFAVLHHVSDYRKSIYNGSAEEFEKWYPPKLGTVRREYGMWDGFPPESVCVAFPLCTPIMGAGSFDDGDARIVYHPDYPLPRIGISPCGDRCSYEHDAKFDQSVEEYEEAIKVAMS